MTAERSRDRNRPSWPAGARGEGSHAGPGHGGLGHSGPGRGESGYVLMVVLAAMTVGFLLITALLAMSFATHRAAIVQQRLASEQRAVDGALETSLARVRAAYNAPGQIDPCVPFAGGDPELAEIAFDAGTDGTGDDATVRLECDEVLGTGGGSAGTMQLVGDGYASVPGGTDWVGWDWASALDDPPGSPTAGLSPALVHEGAEPLRFNGGVAVRSGAAALLDGSGSEGAVDIRGGYVQGAAGHGGTGSQCGMLSPVFPNGDASRTAVVDDDATPECGSGAAAALAPTAVIDGPTGSDGGSTPAVVASPSCQGDTTFIPGDYDAVKTAALNALFSQECTAVYHFQPGDYWFDAGGTDSTLVFDDATSAFVFGTLQGSGVGATCDPAAANGAKVVLSARTTIRHLGGNVSICADGGEGHALVQSQLLPSGIELSNAVSGSHCYKWPCDLFGAPRNRHDAFSNAAGVLVAASGTLPGAVGKVDCYPVDTVITSGPACKLPFSVGMNAASDRAMDTVEVVWTSSEAPNSHPSDRQVAVEINKGGATLCSVPYQNAGRTTGFMTAVDLTGCLGGQPESFLDGATMKVTFSYPDFFGGEQLVLSLRGLHMRVNAHEIDGTAATSEATAAVPSPGVAWPGTTAVLTGGDGAGTTYAEPGPCGTALNLLAPAWVCNRSGAGLTEPQPLELSGFDVSAAGFDSDTDFVSSLYLAIDNLPEGDLGDNLIAAPTGAQVRGETIVEVFLDAADGGGSCAVPTQSINTYTRSERGYYIDILGGEDSSTSCRNLLANPAVSMGVLERATVRLSFRPERGTWFGTTPFYNVGLGLPTLDHVRLEATSEVVDRLTRATITNDVAGNTRFRIHGDVTMPRTSIDIRWTGSIDTDAIVNGSMEAHSIGSTSADGASVGIVCCGPGAREVQITAELPDDGGTWEPRGTARAVLDKDPAEDLAGVTVTGWQFCRADACPDLSAPVLSPSP